MVAQECNGASGKDLPLVTMPPASGDQGSCKRTLAAVIVCIPPPEPLFNAGALCYDSFATGWDSQQIRQGLASAGSMPALS